MNDAYKLYRRVTFDFPDSKWAKYARGRLSDPAFERIIQVENEARERMIEALKESSQINDERNGYISSSGRRSAIASA